MRSAVHAAALCGLWAASAGATTLIRLETPDLARKSEVVVRGKVARADAHWTGDHRRIVTDVEIEVAEAFKGQPAKTVVVEQPGGVVGDIGQRVDGIAEFNPGEEVVVFLSRRPGDRYLLTGMAQGKFRVERSSDGKVAFAVPAELGEATLVDPATHQPLVVHTSPMKIEDLRATVRAANASPRPAGQGGTTLKP
jgi:hypothetical protein